MTPSWWDVAVNCALTILAAAAGYVAGMRHERENPKNVWFPRDWR